MVDRGCRQACAPLTARKIKWAITADRKAAVTCRNQGMEVADPKESIRSVSCVVIGIVENKSLASRIAVEGSSTISP
jgi:hypothetical protein